MKNLKLKLTLFAILLSITSVFSQEFYLSLNGGYGFGIGSQDGWTTNSTSKRVYDNANNINSYHSTQENVPFNLGKGFNIGGSVGYMFNANLGFDLGINYHVGAKTESSSRRISQELYNNALSYYSESNYKSTYYAKMFRLVPSVVLTPGFEKFNPYTRIGLVFGFGTMYTENENSSQVTGSQVSSSSSTYNMEMSGGMTIGFNGAIGVDYKTSEKISVFGEANYYGMSYSPTKGLVTKSTQDGVDQLPNMTTYEKETEYVNSFETEGDPFDSPNEDEPSKSLVFSFPYSSLGFNFGVKYSF